MTSVNDGQILRNNTLSAAMDFLALGLDPDQSTFWIQSDVPQVTELTWILSNITSVGMMERGTSYKDKLAKGFKANMGLFSYPILMAADILLFGGERVPVGKDQKQHLEMTRDIAMRFNQKFGNVFVIPEPDIEEENQLIPGLDGQKMSKSYNNTIPIFGEEKVLKKKVMSIVTDSTGVQEVKNADCPLYHIYSLFLNEEEKALLKDQFLTPGTGYGEIKNSLYNHILDYFKPFREKRIYLENHKDFVNQELKKGAKKASLAANKFLTLARRAVGLAYQQ